MPARRLILLKKAWHSTQVMSPNRSVWFEVVAMERARSLSVQRRRNPFWSERIQGEWELQLRRPDALPPVPDDLNLEVELEVLLATDRSQTGRQQSPGRPRGKEEQKDLAFHQAGKDCRQGWKELVGWGHKAVCLQKMRMREKERVDHWRLRLHLPNRLKDLWRGALLAQHWKWMGCNERLSRIW